MADVRPRRDLEAPAPVSDPDENVRPLRERPGEMARASADASAATGPRCRRRK
jgi:hypothetical protein